MRQPTRAARRLAAAPLLAAAVPLLAAGAAAPAAAHGTRAEVVIEQTGDRDLLVRLRWAEDGHPVTEPARVEVSATNSATGQRVGPLAAGAAGAPGDYAVTLPVGDGSWLVDASAAGPVTGSGSRTMQVPLEAGGAPAAAGGPADRRPLVLALLAGGVTALVGVAAVAGANRRARARLAATARTRPRPSAGRGHAGAAGRARPGARPGGRPGARTGAGARPKRRRR